MTCDIGTRQNSPDAILMLRAQRQAYDEAKACGTIQLFLGWTGAFLSLAAAHWFPPAKAWVAIYSELVLLVGLGFLEPHAKKRHELGAKIQELFDELVLGFPWKSRHLPEPGVYRGFAKDHARAKKKAPRDWYPREVNALPLQHARLVCQRSNMDWDALLREDVSVLYALAVVLLVAASFVYILAKRLGADDMVLTVIVPIAPICASLWRKRGEHRAASASAEEAKQHIGRVWERVRAGGVASEELDEEARTIQEGIFDRRLRSPHVPNWLHNFRYKRFEARMKDTADVMVKQAKTAPLP